MKKRLSKANEEMGYRPIDGGQKLKKNGGRKLEQFVLDGKKERFPGNLTYSPWFDYEDI